MDETDMCKLLYSKMTTAFDQEAKVQNVIETERMDRAMDQKY